jgi:hypothetical protein
VCVCVCVCLRVCAREDACLVGARVIIDSRINLLRHTLPFSVACCVRVA